MPFLPPRAARAAFLALAALALLAALAPCSFAAKAVEWRPMTDALLRIDGHPVAEWALYQTGKGINPDTVLLAFSGRYLYIDRHARRIYEIAPDKIQRRDGSLWWDPADRPAKPAEIADWLDKDVGGAWRIDFRLVGENRLLDLQLPHPLDLRSIE